MTPDVPISVTTRFSFLGLSGWKSDPSRNPELLFEDSRLKGRLVLFETVALASLAAQTDPGFHLHVLTSDQMPGWALERLHEISVAALGPERVTIDPRPEGRARKFHRIHLQQAYGDRRIAQVVLDDDDGLSADFMEILRHKIAETEAAGHLPDLAARHFLSFPFGYGLVHSDGPTELYRHRYKLINLGLTMLGNTDRSIHSIDHRNEPNKVGVTTDGTQPMFLRSVHHLNDSRVEVTDRWKKVPDWRAEAGFEERFGYVVPLLEGLPLHARLRGEGA
jgi:hypothetical protein